LHNAWGWAQMHTRMYIYKQHPQIFTKNYGLVINIKKISITVA